MAAHHVVRCDRAGCTAEEPLKSTNWDEVQIGMRAGHFPYLRDEHPSSWRKAEGRDFCSWECMARWAESMRST